MRILFLNPPGEHTILEFSRRDDAGVVETPDLGSYPPLGLLYVLSYLEAKVPGHELFFVDCIAEQKSHSDFRELVRELRPDIVGITAFTITLVDVVLAAKTVRACCPSAHLCMGGHHAIAFPFEAAQLEPFDSIVVGEGELAFAELVKALDRGEDFTRIRGVYTSKSIEAWRGSTDDDPRFLPGVMVPAAYVDDLDELPAPNRSYIKHIDYWNPIGIRRRMTTMLTSRGCPHRCAFCDAPYKRYRPRDLGKVMDELEACIRLGYEEFHFYDDLFNITPARVIAFCDEVERRGLKFSWGFRGRVDTATRESLVRAKRAGCWMIAFGVETSTDEGLRQIKKQSSAARHIQAFRWARELGITTVAYFIIGFPFEKTKADIRRSVSFLLRLDPDYTVLSTLMLLPNTELFRQGESIGLTSRKRWVDFSLEPDREFTIDYWTEHLSADELIALRRESLRRFYLRPRYVLRRVAEVRSWGELRRKARSFLALFG
jgi:radical SAM superfamily enzyme YgiQ (UPF0313 family)